MAMMLGRLRYPAHARQETDREDRDQRQLDCRFHALPPSLTGHAPRPQPTTRVQACSMRQLREYRVVHRTERGLPLGMLGFVVRFSRFHNFGGDLVLEIDEHPLVAWNPGIHLCKEIVYALSTDIHLAVISMCDEPE